MTAPAHELAIDAANVYRCSCGVTGTWAEMKPHAQIATWNVGGLLVPPSQDVGSIADRLTLPDRDSLLADGLGPPEPKPYDEDAEQDAIGGRPHFGSTIPPKPRRVYFSNRTCQSCGVKRRDHQLRGHDFVEWEARS